MSSIIYKYDMNSQDTLFDSTGNDTESICIGTKLKSCTLTQSTVTKSVVKYEFAKKVAKCMSVSNREYENGFQQIFQMYASELADVYFLKDIGRNDYILANIPNIDTSLKCRKWCRETTVPINVNCIFDKFSKTWIPISRC